MSWYDVFKIIIAGLSTTALSGVIIFGLSNWLGKVWANRILEKEKYKYKKEIEGYKLELDKARNDYQRFSSKKFKIIEETWNAMFEIVKELRIFSKVNDNYIDYLMNTLDIISKYIIIIRRNSLYFNDEISKLLSQYITSCSGVTYLVK